MKTQSIPKLKAKCQLVFNEYIRLRDKDKPCISCGKTHDYKQAGHFYSVRMYDGLRFHEDNCHGECPGCNGFDTMHLLSYSENLKKHIGQDGYEWLKDMAADYKKHGYKWTRYELLELIETYKKKVKELK
jgi:hypothetical protein